MIPAGRHASGQSLDAIILALTRRARGHFGLAPREWLVLLTIVTAAVQRYVRAPETDPRFLDATPLPLHLSGRISRRRVAEVTGLAPETVRRTVLRLIGADLVREERGGLHSRPGILAEMSEAGLVDDLLALLCAGWGSNLCLVSPRKEETARLVAYRLGNTGLGWLVSLQRQYPLSPATVEALLFLLTDTDCASLSERATARAADLPRETLRRHFAQLAVHGLTEQTPLGPQLLPAAAMRHRQHPETRERERLSEQLLQDFLRLGVLGPTGCAGAR
ncbi:MAG: hypothetical protein ACK4TG_01955 [Thermaurantiacus sp.]